MIYKVRIFDETPEEFDDEEEALERVQECIEDLQNKVIQGFAFWWAH